MTNQPRDTQHNNTQHSNTQHNDTQHNDTRHSNTQHTILNKIGLIATLSMMLRRELPFNCNYECDYVNNPIFYCYKE